MVYCGQGEVDDIGLLCRLFEMDFVGFEEVVCGSRLVCVIDDQGATSPTIIISRRFTESHPFTLILSWR